MASHSIVVGDCLDVLGEMEPDSVDSIVTDPPYGLAFMNKKWDQQVPGPEYWSAALRVAKPRSFLLAFGGSRTYHRLACAIEDAGWSIEDQIIWIRGNGRPPAKNRLRPGHDPIVMACKRQGSAGPLRIDDCRIPSKITIRRDGEGPSGRWPSNVVHDGSEEVRAIFPESPNRGWKMRFYESKEPKRVAYGKGFYRSSVLHETTGSTSRYFYSIQASASDRDEGVTIEDGNPHPTVKPTALMAYLTRLVTPPNGLCLDPFAGSGSTGKACVREGFSFIGIEIDPFYAGIARQRIEHEKAKRPLFDPK